MERRKFLSAVTAAIPLPLLSSFGSGNAPDETIRPPEIPQANNAAAPANNVPGTLTYPDGMPVPFQWFTDDRLSFEADDMGITRVTYLNPLTRSGNPTIFLRRLFDGFRFYIEQNHVTYSPQLKNYSFQPFGFSSDWLVNGIVIRYGIYAVEESIVFNIQLPGDAPSDLDCKLEFYESFRLTPSDRDDFMFGNWGADRKWGEWHFDASNNALSNRYTDEPVKRRKDEDNQEDSTWKSFLNICITADFELSQVVRQENPKRILRSKEKLQPGKSYTYLISFIPEEDAIAKTKAKLARSQQTINEQINHYSKIAQKHPVLISQHPELNNFMALAPLFIEVLKVKKIPGAIRSNNMVYWVWGWDGMVSNASLAYWGDTDYIKQMLGCYMETADPVKGIVHAFRNDMSIALYSPTTSQSIYISLLYLHYSQTRDLEEVRKRYAFSKKIFEDILALEIQNTGLCVGTSLFPDFPRFMKETGKDASLFNNSLFYSAARSMECLAILMKDTATRDKARAVFTRIEKNLLAKFFNEEKGFFVSSIDAETLAQRDSYNLSSVKWDMGCYNDLVETVSPRSMEFMATNLVSNVSLREIPLWNESFDGDGNQLHCWFTANAQYFIRTANENNRADLLAKFRGWVEYWTSKLTIPEAINYYAENVRPERERWNSPSGNCQMFGAKEWYLAVLHGIVGLDSGPGGITFYPYDGDEMTLQGFHYMGKQFDIEMKGSGKYISEINVDGKKILGTNILPLDSFQNTTGKNIRVIVKRTRQQQSKAFIKSGYGVELHEYNFLPGAIKTKVGGLGTCNLKIHAETEPRVLVNGKKTTVRYHRNLQLAVVKLVFDDDRKKLLELFF